MSVDDSIQDPQVYIDIWENSSSPIMLVDGGCLCSFKVLSFLLAKGVKITIVDNTKNQTTDSYNISNTQILDWAKQNHTPVLSFPPSIRVYSVKAVTLS